MDLQAADQIIRETAQGAGLSVLCPIEGRCLSAAPNVDEWFARCGLMFEVPGIDGPTSRPLAEVHISGAELHEADAASLNAMIVDRVQEAKRAVVAMLREAADRLEAIP